MKRQPLTEMAESIQQDLREIREVLRRPMEEEAARARITGPQRSVMHAVIRSDGMSVKALAAQVGLSHSTVSGIVDRLVARGLVERRVNGADRRFALIVVTMAVRDFMQKNAPALTAQPLFQALRRASPAERQSIEKGLATLRRLLGN